MRCLLASLGLCLVSTLSSASPYDSLIDAAAYRHGVDPIVMRSVVQRETRKHPWTFNSDGEGFFLDTKQEAISALWQISQNPWLVKIKPHGQSASRTFFANEADANRFLKRFVATEARNGKTYTQRTDDSKAVESGQIRLRKLWVVNTDIGISQVNFRFHGSNKVTVQQWFDPSYNLNYAAQLLASHKRGGKSDLEAAGDYHSKTPSVRAKYLRALKPIYEKEKARAVPALAIN